MDKDKLRMLREAIEDNLDPETLIDILDLKIYDILDAVDDELLISYYDELTDAMPSFSLNNVREEE